jgi:DNA modification methylase
MRPYAIHGDMREVLQEMAERGVQFDSVVTDPPYHLTSIVKRFGAANAAPAKHGTDGVFARSSKGFMGKTWDGGDISMQPETWRMAYDVLKPGGYLLAFGGTRTWHRIAVAIEDAGFEIRDTVCWLYGTGFPKSHDASKGIDALLLHGGSNPVRLRKANESRPGDGRVGPSLPNNGIMTSERVANVVRDEAATPEAAKWQGWGTALKPAFEPIIMARKPLIGTVAQNILLHGAGGINIDDCRLSYTSDYDAKHQADIARGQLNAENGRMFGGLGKSQASSLTPQGRWPANVIHDGSEEVEALFAEYGNHKSCNSPSSAKPEGRILGGSRSQGAVYPGEAGSVSRFFYSAKASKADRAGSSHPTVKPIALMQYLCRLVTPPKGMVLDPFAGSGTTLEAAYREGFLAIGIEQQEEYMADIDKRLASL